MGSFGDEWERHYHDYKCQKAKEWRLKVWERFERIYEIRHGKKYEYDFFK